MKSPSVRSWWDLDENLVSIHAKEKEIKAEPKENPKEKDKRVALSQPHGHSGINEEASMKLFQTNILEIST